MKSDAVGGERAAHRCVAIADRNTEPLSRGNVRDWVATCICGAYFESPKAYDAVTAFAEHALEELGAPLGRSPQIVKFCAEECVRQQVGPLRVWSMYEAWLYAMAAPVSQLYDRAFLQQLGRLVEPEKNRQGWRTVNVRVGYDIPPRAGSPLNDALDRFFEHAPNMTADEWYVAFEKVHPFLDGNGRVGQIGFNMLARTMNAPTEGPKFWEQP